MAKQRVQVQDLPDAPSLQPTVLQRGREAIVTRQAGRNSLLDLADTLKQVNPALRDYGAIQDLDAENFEKELQRLSPEERRKLVTQERDEMDKLVRKNVIPFMGNAWNWKRKSRAIGALMHDEFQQVLQENLDDPKWADQSVDEIVQMTREALEDGAPILKTDTYAREGFQEAINPTVNAYKLKYDKIKDDAERLRIKDATQSQIHRITSMGVSSEGAKEIEEIWQSIEGSLTPKQLENIIEHVALTHAAAGNTKAAKEFARFAAGHLKMGTSLMGDPNTKQDDTFGQYTDKVSALMETIDRADKARGDEDAREARKILAGIAAEASQMYYRASNHDFSKGAFQVNPDDPNSETIESPDALYNYLFEKHSGNDNAFVGAGLSKTLRDSEGLAQIPDTNLVPLNNTFQTLYGPAVRTALESATILQKLTTGKLTTEGAVTEYSTKALEAETRYQKSVDDKRREMVSGQYLTVDNEVITSETDLEVMSKHLKEWTDKYAEKYTEEIKDLSDDIMSVQEVVGQTARLSGEDQNTDTEDQASFILPDKTIGDLSTVFGDDKHMGRWENLEEAAVEGNRADGKQAVRGLRRGGKLADAYNVLQGFDKEKKEYEAMFGQPMPFADILTTTPEQKRVAARKLMLAMVADGVFLKGDRALAEGRISFDLGKGETVSVDLDMKALKKLIPLYPLITREQADRAVLANKNKTDYNESYIRKVIANIEGVAEKNILDEQINTFLKLQIEVHKRFNTE